MATRGARALRAAVVTAAVTGLLAVAAPAHAQPNVQLEGIGNIELKVGGGTQTVQIRVRNQAPPGDDPAANTARDVRLTMTLPLGNEGVGIATAGEGCTTSGNPPTRMDCAIPELPPGQERTVVVQIGVDPNSGLQAGQERNGTAQVTLATGGTQSFNIRLRGPDQAPSITQVSGAVRDQATGEPIGDARVILIDGAGTEHSRGTDGQGRFDIRPEPNRPIAPGRIALLAQKTGYEGQQYQHPVPVDAGQSVTDIQLVMINQQVEATPTPEPSESPTPEPTASATATAAAPPPPVEEDGGLTFFTKLMIIIGVLLVLLGIGAIALLIWRRRREADEDDGGFDDADDPVSGPRGPTPTPGGRGAYRPTPTQVAGSGAATQVIPRAGTPGSGLPAVGPNPALARTSLLNPGAGPSDATTVLPRADDPTRVTGGPADASTRLMGAAGASDATQVMGAAGAAPGSAAPASAGGPTAGSPPLPRRAAPQPPTYNGAPERPYAGGYDQGGYSAGREPGYGDPRPGASGYDEPTGRFDRGYGAEPRAGGSYGRASHDSGYGPDPYTQPASGGYDDYGADPYATGGADPYPAGGSGSYPADGSAGYPASGGGSYPAGGSATHSAGGSHSVSGSGAYPAGGGAHSYPAGGGYESEEYRGGYDSASYDSGGYDAGGYERGGYQGGSYDAYSGPGYQGGGEYGGYGQPSADQYGHATGGYGQPGIEGQPSSAEGYPDYYDETGRPRPRHPDRRWPEN